jgi:putative sigma-54 modulation protein
MSADEAAAQMELVDHDFFLFINEEGGAVSVLYRRRDGEYGLIESEDRFRA